MLTRSSAKAQESILPQSLPPRGLSRVQAAEYIGVSPTKFDELVKDGRMPPAKRIDARTVWDRLQLDIAFAALPDEAGRAADNWDRVAV
jgi:hypothetical protein